MGAIIDYLIRGFGFACNVTCFVAMAIGLFHIWNWLILEVLLRRAIYGIKAYTYFIAWLHFRKDFRQWYDEFKERTIREAAEDTTS